ncbi:MAG: SsrA-binding protein SmpB [Phaeodactylibacter xiamenensis]|uniref:SsrA-binding protein n=1 Tax=Phaeodactylibacter xiamenensis TaxID=1524460 RepID=A0A098SD66_9BACT|nr:SsrA-binding protein SmpB [Phaeodactylibacter xiamenensis]KGE88932.1 single-stranded DNA-binding protein [Phaeodactylibacter xiamenensis]MCR9052687.1 SsrA-binding protein SmpB [bacterium]
MGIRKTKEHDVEIINRKAGFEYRFLDTFEAGIMLHGTEVKSIRKGNANLRDAYCFFRKGELYIKSLFIAEYEHGNMFNHESRRTRKLLLKRRELGKLEKQLKEKGLTIVPIRLYINERGLAKLEIALAQGKKVYDKRESIKQKDVNRDLDRIKKMY